MKWHKLRQRGDDAPFSRANLRRGLAAGPCIEIGLRRLASGEFVCLHDDRLESETTGSGPVNAADRGAVSRLQMRDGPHETPLFLDQACAIMRSEPVHASALLHLDLKIGASEIDDRACQDFTAIADGLGRQMILGGDDRQALSQLGRQVAGLIFGYDPTDAVVAGEGDVLDLVARHAPDAHSVYLHRGLVRAVRRRGDRLVGALQDRGYWADCWTIDHGDPGGAEDLLAALEAG